MSLEEPVIALIVIMVLFLMINPTDISPVFGRQIGNKSLANSIQKSSSRLTGPLPLQPTQSQQSQHSAPSLPQQQNKNNIFTASPQTRTSPLFAQPTIRQPQNLLQPVIPYFRFPQQLLPAEPTSQQGSTTEGFNANGSINSLIYTTRPIWIPIGNWSMSVNNGSVTSFNTNMIWYNNIGTSTHTHEFLRFKPSIEKIVITQRPVDTIFLKGTMDVGTNHRVSWVNVPSTISIYGGKVITISLNDGATNHHFAGQPIFGIVHSFIRCSNVPGPNMEVLPPCTSP